MADPTTSTRPNFPIDPAWEHFTASSKQFTETAVQCPDGAYLTLTLSTPSAASPPGIAGPPPTLAVQRIVFTTDSHDQGYSSNYGIGTYAGSYSFFEAHVVNPQTGRERVPRRRVQYNLHASSDFRTHVNIWDRRDEALALAGPGAANWATREDFKGVTLASWMAAICAGDEVRLVPKAFFPRWQNVVRSARIDVWAEKRRLPVVVTRLPLFETVKIKDPTLYRKLNRAEKEVRLVVIEPAARGEDDLRLAIRHTSLADPGHITYEALSYCWGDTNHSKTATLTDFETATHDAEIHIRESLFSALKLLRRANAPRTMWIDLICINQTETDERAWQITMMGEIFASAASVRVWLGDGNDETSRDFEVFRSIAQHYDNAMSKATCPVVNTETAGDGSSSITPDTGCPGPRTTHSTIKDAGSFYHVNSDTIFQQPWFQRVWVLQEVWNSPSPSAASSAAAKNKPARVTVHCGKGQVPWETVAQANRCLYDQSGYINNIAMPRLLTDLFEIKRDVGSAVPTRVTCTPAPRRDILSIVIAGIGLQATDPRDKIFALLGFGTETHRIADLPDLVRPDYTKSAARVYADFTRWWILHHRSLRILSAVHTLERRPWLDVARSRDGARSAATMTPPQLAPGRDGSCSPSWALWSAGNWGWARGILAIDEAKCPYEATKGTEVDTDLLKLPSIQPLSPGQPDPSLRLALRGIRLGTITAEPVHCPYFQREPLPKGLRTAYEQLFDPSGADGTFFNARTGLNRQLSTEKREEESRLHFRLHKEEGKARADNREPMTWLPCLGKCVFTTEWGAQGLCPSNAAQADVVVLLFGGRVPYLVRYDAARVGYLFVGECYLEGAMGGEILALMRAMKGGAGAGADVEEVFTLV